LGAPGELATLPGAFCFCGKRSNIGARRELVNKRFDPFAGVGVLASDRGTQEEAETLGIGLQKITQAFRGASGEVRN